MSPLFLPGGGPRNPASVVLPIRAFRASLIPTGNFPIRPLAKRKLTVGPVDSFPVWRYTPFGGLRAPQEAASSVAENARCPIVAHSPPTSYSRGLETISRNNGISQPIAATITDARLGRVCNCLKEAAVTGHPSHTIDGRRIHRRPYMGALPVARYRRY